MRNDVEQAQVVRVDKRVIYQPSATRVSGHVFNLIAKVLRIADSMLVEASLPHLSSELFPNRKGKPAFDALHAPLHGLTTSRRQHDMKMFWHDNKGMQQESSLVPVGEHSGYQKFRVRGSAKKRPSLKGNGGDGVGIDDTPRV
jgi:hypothetical protein